METGVFETQVLIPRGQRDGYRDGGVSRSSDEVSVMDRERRAGGLKERKRETMTGFSNTRLTWTTKLDRIGSRAQTHPDTVFGVVSENGKNRTLRVRRSRYPAVQGRDRD